MTALCIRCWNGVVSDCTSALSTQRLLGRLVVGSPFFVSSSEDLTPIHLGGLLDHIGYLCAAERTRPVGRASMIA